MMDHAITWGDVLVIAAISAGIAAVLWVIIWFLTILGRGMSR